MHNKCHILLCVLVLIAWWEFSLQPGLIIHAEEVMKTKICFKNMTKYYYNKFGKEEYSSEKIVLSICCKGYSSPTFNLAQCDANCTSWQGCAFPEPCPEMIWSQCAGCIWPFEMDESDCFPDCPAYCNANCTEPHKCSCPAGYVFSAVDRGCKPVCLGLRRHCDCVAPDTCRCHAGYVEDNGTCVADCPQTCTDSAGTCRQPNVCGCDEGYDLDVTGNACVPSCEPKLHCRCTAPNVCGKCTGGYYDANYAHVLNASNVANVTNASNVATVNCVHDCDPSLHCRCLGKNVCEQCMAGYHDANVTNASNVSCIPDCDPRLHCRCIAPNACGHCVDGYHNVANTSNIVNVATMTCVPNCPDEYANEYANSSTCVQTCVYTNCNCTAADVCECLDGFGTADNGTCFSEMDLRAMSFQEVAESPYFIVGACVTVGIAAAGVAWAAWIYWRNRDERARRAAQRNATRRRRPMREKTPQP